MTSNAHQDHLLPYSPQTAIDLAQEADRGAPRKLWRWLYPLWEVEIPGTRIVRRDLEPLEAAMLRAMRDGQVHAATDLAMLLGIDQALLDRLIATQIRIGHMTREGDSLALARLGTNSLRDGISYRREEGGSGTVYFDAFTLTPLPEQYGRAMLLAPEDRDLPAAQRFLAPLVARDWELAALKPVVTSRVLPNVQPRPLFLPLYLVRTATGACVTLTAARDRRDPFFEECLKAALASDPFLPSALSMEVKEEREALGTWLLQRHLGSARLVLTPGGEWRAQIAPEHWQRGVGGLALDRLGAYDLVPDTTGGQACLRLWCEERNLRREAADLQIRALLVRATTLPKVELMAKIARLEVRLELRDAPVAAAAPAESGGRKKRASRG